MYKGFLFLCLVLFSATVISKVEFDLGGRLEIDYSYYDDDYTQFIQDDYDVRRFRFGLFTKFNDKFSAYFQTDFSNSRKTRNASTQAAWLRYRFNKSNEDKTILLDIIAKKLTDIDNNIIDVEDNKLTLTIKSFDIFVATVKE